MSELLYKKGGDEVFMGETCLCIYENEAQQEICLIFCHQITLMGKITTTIQYLRHKSKKKTLNSPYIGRILGR